MLDAGGEVKNVTGDWVADFDAGVRAGKFAGVAGIAEMVENGVAEHQREYGKPVRCAQRRSGEARLQDAQPEMAVPRSCFPDGYFCGGKYFLSMPAMTT